MFADIGSNPIGSDIGESLDPGRIRQIDDIGSEEGSDPTIVLFENFRFQPAPEGKWGRNTAVCMGIPTRLGGTMRRPSPDAAATARSDIESARARPGGGGLRRSPNEPEPDAVESAAVPILRILSNESDAETSAG